MASKNNAALPEAFNAEAPSHREKIGEACDALMALHKEWPWKDGFDHVDVWRALLKDNPSAAIAEVYKMVEWGQQVHATLMEHPHMLFLVDAKDKEKSAGEFLVTLGGLTMARDELTVKGLHKDFYGLSMRMMGAMQKILTVGQAFLAPALNLERMGPMKAMLLAALLAHDSDTSSSGSDSDSSNGDDNGDDDNTNTEIID